MPHRKPEDLPSTLERWPNVTESYRAAAWGDMEVSYSIVPQPLDCTTFLDGSGHRTCICPHYGFLLEGRLRCTYPGADMPDEVATAGEVYYFPAGHVLVYEEPTKAIDFSPGDAFRQVMDMAERKRRR
jgi:hypothetical protein